MLKLNPNPEFSASVPITEPGKAEPTIITVTYRYKTRDALVEFIEQTKDAPVADVLCDIVSGWNGVDAPFTKENLKALVNSYMPAGLEMLKAYYKELAESKIKN